MLRVLISIMIVVIVLTPGCLQQSEIDFYQGEDIDPAQMFRPFQLQQDNNSTFNSSSLEGKVTVFGFIYVNCPDVCPTTTTDMAWMQSQLTDEDRENVSLISITVDPWRDGPIGLTSYKQEYNVTWPHLTTTVDSEANLSLIERVWSDFSIGVVLTEANSSTNLGRGHTVYYDLDHTNGVVLVDANGYQRVRWTHENWNPEGILNDVRSMANDVQAMGSV